MTLPHDKNDIDSRLDDAWRRSATSGTDCDPTVLRRVKERIDRVIDSYELRRATVARRWKMWGVAAAALVPLMAVALVWLVIGKQTPASGDIYASVSTAKGERATVFLPDGTEVLLNSESTLTYGASLETDSVRMVQFSGEAFFKVAKNPTRPFVVDVDHDMTLRVLGTEFNINAPAGAPDMCVALTEGSVALAAPGGTKVKLAQGDLATYNRASHGFKVTHAPNDAATAWIRHQKTYTNVSPDSLIRLIETHYEIELAENVRRSIDDSFTGTLPDDNLTETLVILSKIYRFDVADGGMRFQPAK